MGAATYISGKPCRHGHTGPRYASTQGCVECVKARTARVEKEPWRKEQKKAWAKRSSSRREQWRTHNRKRRGASAPTRPMPVCCECCGKKSSHTLAEDHDHITTLFRGWICRKCNVGIGLLGDQPPGVRRALAYLERS